MPDDLDAALRDVFEVFRRDLVKYEQAVNRALRVPVIAQHEFDALVSFHYNTGGIARAKLTAHLNNGDRKAAAAAFMGWVRPPEIKGRRKAEQALFETGRYPEGNIPVFPVSSSGRVTFRAVRSVRPSEALALMSGTNPAPAQPDPAEQPRGWLAAILALVARIFGKGKA
jgi:lysozyme